MIKRSLCVGALLLALVGLGAPAYAATLVILPSDRQLGDTIFSTTGSVEVFAASDFFFVDDNIETSVLHDVLGTLGDTDFTIDVSTLGGESFAGSSTQVGSGSSSVEILFAIDPGANFTGLTSNLVLATFSGPFFPADPLSGDFLDPSASLTLTNVNVIPLPAGGLLLLTALGALGLVRIRRRNA